MKNIQTHKRENRFLQAALLRVLAQRLGSEGTEELIPTVDSAAALNQLDSAGNVAVGRVTTTPPCSGLKPSFS